MDLASKAFDEGGTIPSVYTCDGENISPPLHWSNAPEGTRSFVLIVNDPDAPVGDWVHWVLYNLPGDFTELNERIPSKETLPSGALQGRNDFKKIGYGGPCPPSGVHRYYFRLFALSSTLSLTPGATRKDVQHAMQGHTIGEAVLMGKYQRKKQGR
jgi:Raf kinase inhibitor-like YbhB/YbcL family protein